MSESDLNNLVDDKESVVWILKGMKDVRSFLAFESIVRTGVSVGFESLPFERLMVFSWIKDLINERKT